MEAILSQVSKFIVFNPEWSKGAIRVGQNIILTSSTIYKYAITVGFSNSSVKYTNLQNYLR